MAETPTERLLYECVHALGTLIHNTEEWRRSPFAFAMDRVARELGYRDATDFYQQRYVEPSYEDGSGPFP